MKARSFALPFIASWSLVNVIFLEQWHLLLRVRDPQFSYWMTDIAPANYLALIANVFFWGIIGAVIAFVARDARSRASRIAGWTALAVGLLYFLNAIRRELFFSSPHAAWMSIAAVFVLIAIVGVVVVALRRKAGRSLLGKGMAVGLIFAPFLLWTHVSAARILASGKLESDFTEAPRTASEGKGTPRRVVILILDEADYGLMFDHRPKDLQLPNFDRLRRESVFATDAHAPAGDTDPSILSYLTGRRVVSMRPVSSRDAAIRFADDTGRDQFFSAQPTLFDRARAQGARIGVTGWAAPYCRFTNLHVESCEARGGRTVPTRFLNAAAWQLAEVLTIGPLLDRAYGFGLPYHTRDYLHLQRAAEDMIATDSLDLVWIHLPVPHLPRMYDRRTGRLVGPEHQSRTAYFDNLAYADIAVRRILALLDSTRRASETSLIVTSDHPYRFAERDGLASGDRIPFMVRVGAASQGCEAPGRLDVVHVGSLALEILSGLQSPVCR